MPPLLSDSPRELLELFFRHAPVAVAMFDQGMRYLAASDRWLKDYRVEAGQVIGRSHYDVLPSTPQRWRDIHARCLAEGSVASGQDDVIIRENGRHDWLDWEVRPFHASGGLVAGLIIFSEFTTARKEAEQARREQERRLTQGEQRLADFIGTGSDWLWEMDASLRFSFLSERPDLLGPSGSAAVGLTRWELAGVADPDADPGWRAHKADLLARRPFRDFEFEHHDAAMRGQWRQVSGRPVLDEQGRFIGYRGVTRDITPRKTAELRIRQLKDEAELARRAAEEASQAKTRFLASMSHEIRTPMTGVLGMADLLAMADIPAQEKAHVEAIRASGRHLLSIINDILDFSRIEAGRLELERVDFAVAEVLERVRSILGPQAVEHGLNLAFRPDRHAELIVRGDQTRLTQVLINLIGNAIKFTPAGGVTLSTSQLPQGPGRVRLRFEVRDTGIGIEAERQEALFEPFTQVDDSVARRFGGSGLGLAICKRLVEAMGGGLGLESRPGQGSLFWFEVPFEPGDATALARKVGPGTPPARTLRILVVEDVPINRDLMRTMLGSQGHRVSCAENGREAVDLVAREAFDVILMDVQMPVMDGLEATRRIRALPMPAAGVPILALTANVMANEHERCLQAGMSRVLTKPVVWPELFAALANLDGVQPEGS